MAVAYTEENSGGPRPSPAQPSPAPYFVSASKPGHCLGSILALICNLPCRLLVARQPEQQPSLGWCPMSPPPSALRSPALSRSLPVSEARHQATTFKYLLSRLQRARASGQLHWNKQTLKTPLPSQFDNTSEFTNDPHVLWHQASHLLRATSLVVAATWHESQTQQHPNLTPPVSRYMSTLKTDNKSSERWIGSPTIIQPAMGKV